MPLLKRRWVYIMPPQAYEIFCDKCGGDNITWSEWRGRIWCYRCQLDTFGNAGIFDGPIPIQGAEILGLSFDRIHLATGRLMKVKILRKRVIWKFQKENPK